LLVIGLFTRFAAASLLITMSVAFFLAHKAVLKGQGNGELAFIYLAVYFALFVAGGGRFSLDAKMGGKT
jgi:putative oxidoreductase